MKCSVIIPAYRAAAFIQRAIRSVQEQTEQDFEILVIDDASPDDTANVVAKLAKSDKRIKLLRQKKNGGPAVARNRGLDESKGKWVAILDADDAWLPERLEKMIGVAEAGNLDMIADNILAYDAGAEKVVRLGFKASAPLVPWTLEGHFINNMPGRMFTYGWLKPIYRAKYLMDGKFRYQNRFRYGEDFLFYAELLQSGAKAMITAKGYYVYTLRVGELSGQSSGQSQTNVDGGELLEGLDFFKKKYKGKLSDKIQRTLAMNESEIKSYVYVIKLKQALRERHFGQALGILFAKPKVWPFLARAFLRRITNGLNRV